jgi:predicted transcriptional regulator
MSATSLKLSKELKQRIGELVDGTNKTAHAFMIDAIEQVARQEELRRRFGAEAAAAEQEAEQSGKVYDAKEAFTYLESRARGIATKKPRTKTWRRSG